jgi:predicted RecA/RadA family phage recombinase
MTVPREVAIGTARVGGVPFKHGNMLGVWAADATSTQVPVLLTEGFWRMNAHTGQAFTAGNILYWNGTSTGKLTTTVTGITIGRALYAKSSSTATGYVQLWGANGVTVASSS